jgi:hypothetical protein
MDGWLSRTKQIQRETYGRDLENMSEEEKRQYITVMFRAAISELVEASDETDWKPWAVRAHDALAIPNPQIFCAEIVDAQMFLANMLVAAGITDDEYTVIYKAKWVKNIARQERGNYVSRKGIDKCTNCGRSFDDVGQGPTPGTCTVCEPALEGLDV